MGRVYQHQPKWKSIRVPLRVIESVYGRDNFDNAGDDMGDDLRELSDWPGQYRCRFNFDTVHPNPWYHALVFEVEGVPDPVIARLVEMLIGRGLIPSSDTPDA
ncbi:hypothetical protein Psta_0265 [Pirellula staleyi DSM 6068]|uniref:Uncharacterized protein n=1 Tax=Pirellula staleyi (strain ATCC 27377 / DSM 6068 / ICPB 4128) TaxID=530564 RepID=D2R1H5_PIRSD|nr:hypothetical protein [Pirellula staleyi]ADB14960.1 hypothetical protein Psta_0265 [Pirellula staleyi DSM 6068]